MFGEARLVGAAPYKALMIPETAVVTDGPRRVAYVVGADGKVGVKPLQLGPSTGGLRVVRSGLRPDDKVIIGGLQRAMPGQPVQTQPGKITRQAEAKSADTPLLTSAPAASATPAD